MKRSSQRQYFQSQGDWRAWLAENHATAHEIWLVIHKKHTGKAGLTYAEALEVQQRLMNTRAQLEKLQAQEGQA